MNVSKILRQARLKRGESQAKVAQRLGVSQQLVSRIERRGGSLRQIALLSRGLGLHLAVQIGDQTVTLVHPIDPDERKEIEANIAWFSRLAPVDRLRVSAIHFQAAQVLQEAGRRGR